VKVLRREVTLIEEAISDGRTNEEILNQHKQLNSKFEEFMLEHGRCQVLLENSDEKTSQDWTEQYIQ